ncbi:MAG: hypothetical protein ACP6IS_01350 [Candidatus Asgardarchaeia archaeon]
MSSLSSIKELFWRIKKEYESWSKVKEDILKIENLQTDFSCNFLFSTLNEIGRNLFDGVPPPGVTYEAKVDENKFIIQFYVKKEFFIYENGKVVVKRCESDEELKEIIQILIPEINQNVVRGVKYTTPCGEIFPRYEAIIEKMPNINKITENLENKRDLLDQLKFKIINFLGKKIVNGTFRYSAMLKISCKSKGVSIEFSEKYPVKYKMNAPIKLFNEIITTIGGD